MSSAVERTTPVIGARARQKAETRARILEAALEAFAERGFEGASVRDIAAAVGVNHGLIKYHFQDKDRLWKAAVDFLFDRLHEEMQAPEGQQELTSFDDLCAWIRRYVRYCARHPEHARIMVQESIRDSERLRWAVERHIRPDHERLSEITAAYIRKGIYPDIPAHSLTYILIAAAQMLFALGAEVRELYGLNVQDPAVVDAHADAIIAFLFDHRVPPAVR